MRFNTNCGITHLIGRNLYDADAFFQSGVFDSDSRAHFHSKSFQRFIILIKLNTLHSWNECVSVNSNLWYNSLNWSYLYDADAFFQFRVLIRILELIFIPNHSRDSLF